MDFTSPSPAPDGALVAVTDNTATVQKMFVHLPASRAVYVGATLTYFDHFDWQGSSRVGSTWARALYLDTSYDAFGTPTLAAHPGFRSRSGFEPELGFSEVMPIPARLTLDWLGAKRFTP